jgi:hypothetical protein
VGFEDVVDGGVAVAVDGDLPACGVEALDNAGQCVRALDRIAARVVGGARRRPVIGLRQIARVALYQTVGERLRRAKKETVARRRLEPAAPFADRLRVAPVGENDDAQRLPPALRGLAEMIEPRLPTPGVLRRGHALRGIFGAGARQLGLEVLVTARRRQPRDELHRRRRVETAGQRARRRVLVDRSSSRLRRRGRHASERQRAAVGDAEMGGEVIIPASGDMRLPGPGFYEIRGFAWSGRGRVARVDVSTDGAKTWTPAEIEGTPEPICTVRFKLPWAWAGDAAVLKSRCVDKTGYVQSSRGTLVAERGLNAFYHYNGVQSWGVAKGHVITQDAGLDAGSLPKIERPNRSGFHRDPRPKQRPTNRATGAQSTSPASDDLSYDIAPRLGTRRWRGLKQNASRV